VVHTIIGPDGKVAPKDAETRAELSKIPGEYATLLAGTSTVILTLDEKTGAAPRAGETVMLCGDLSALPLLDLLPAFGQARISGRMVIKRGQDERVMVLREGDVASMGSNSPSDRLGQFLLRMGKVTAEQLENAFSQLQTGKRLGQILVSSGAVTPHELWESIQEQITDIFCDAALWTEGSFLLYRFPDGQKFLSTPPLSVNALMMETVRRADEMSVFRERIPNARTFLVPTGKAAPDSAPEEARTALEHVGAGARVEEVGALMHLGEFDVTKILAGLVRVGVLEQGSAPVAAPPPGGGFVLGEREQEIINVYNLAFREIFDEVQRSGRVADYSQGVAGYLKDESITYNRLFGNLDMDGSGSFPVDPMVANLGTIKPDDPQSYLQEALNEMTFFLLFQCGELLDARSDENLGRRVRLIHATLGD
jgi:hypothetical protein